MMFDHTAVSPNTPWQMISVTWLTTTAITDTSEYRIGLWARPSRSSVSTAATVPRPQPGSAFARATLPYHSADGLGVRTKVSRSTATSPNVGPYPSAHSKLSSSDQYV